MRPLEIPSAEVISATDASAIKQEQEHITHTATMLYDNNDIICININV